MNSNKNKVNPAPENKTNGIKNNNNKINGTKDNKAINKNEQRKESSKSCPKTSRIQP